MMVAEKLQTAIQNINSKKKEKREKAKQLYTNLSYSNNGPLWTLVVWIK